MIAPGIYPAMSFPDYLALEAASKGKLHAIHTKTPAHALVTREPSKEMVWGTAFHLALLEPAKFETGVAMNPHDGRTKAGKDFVAENAGKVIVNTSDYNDIIRARDVLLGNPTIRALVQREGMTEATGIWIDPETGVLCRCRPDHYVPDLKIMVDLKTTTNAGPDAFARTAETFGYDIQDAMYSEGWGLAGGGDVEDFIFVVVEREPPYAHAIYQLDEPERARGRQIMRKALARYAECKGAGRWPGFPTGVSRLKFRDWVHQSDANNGLYQEDVA
jgi:hypothetical protein